MLKATRKSINIPDKTIENELRFQRFVDKTDNCHNWLGNKPSGYGQFWLEGKMYRAHRVAYSWYCGTLDTNLQVNHKCNNKSCVNPQHLYLGTARQNANDTKKGKLSREDIEMIQNNRNVNELSEKFNVSKSTIRRVLNKLTFSNTSQSLPRFVKNGSKTTYYFHFGYLGKTYREYGFKTPSEAHNAALLLRKKLGAE